MEHDTDIVRKYFLTSRWSPWHFWWYDYIDLASKAVCILKSGAGKTSAPHTDRVSPVNAYELRPPCSGVFCNWDQHGLWADLQASLLIPTLKPQWNTSNIVLVLHINNSTRLAMLQHSNKSVLPISEDHVPHKTEIWHKHSCFVHCWKDRVWKPTELPI